MAKKPNNVIDAQMRFALRQDQHRADMILSAYLKNMDSAQHPHLLDAVMRDVIQDFSNWEHAAVAADTNMAFGNDPCVTDGAHARYRFIFTLVAAIVEQREPDETDTFLYVTERHLTDQEVEEYWKEGEASGFSAPRDERFTKFREWFLSPESPNPRLGVGRFFGVLMQCLPEYNVNFHDFAYEEDRGVLVVQHIGEDPHYPGKYSVITSQHHARYLAEMEAIVDERFGTPKGEEPK